MGEDHNCIWRQRSNAMLELVNAALSLADATIIVSAADTIK